MALRVTPSPTLSAAVPTASAPRRTRLAGLALVGVALALVAPACSGSPTASAAMTSEVRPTVPSDEFAPPDDPGAEETIPGLDELEEELGDLGEGLGDLGDCADLGLAYSQLVVIALTSDDPATEIDAVIGELKDKVPDELQDDLQVVADTFAEAGSGGILDATGAMSDPEFSAANEAITDWISTECSGG